MKALFFILIFLSGSAPSGLAQSGRNKNPPPSPSPSPADKPSAPRPAASPSPLEQPKASPTPAPTPKFHPKAFVITGRAILESKSWWRSDDVKAVADDIKAMWDLERVPVKIVKGGKMTRTQAVARAKQEPDSYVLYMEIHVADVGMTAREKVDHIDYVLLMPQTGEVVRQFKVEPGTIVQTNDNGARVPQGHSTDYYMELRRCAWDMARVLRYWL